jgi:hypothetical protein
MLFEPRVYNLSILMVRPIPLHSFNRAGSVRARGWGTVVCIASHSHCRIAEISGSRSPLRHLGLVHALVDSLALGKKDGIVARRTGAKA